MFDYVRNIIEEEGPRPRRYRRIRTRQRGRPGTPTPARASARPRHNEVRHLLRLTPPCCERTAKGYWVLSDESDDPRITIPACHVFSAEDPLSWMSCGLSKT